MLKTVFLLVFICLSKIVFCQSYFADEIVARDSNKIKNGPYLLRCDGHILVSGYYKNNHQVGPWIFYSYAGDILLEAAYNEGFRNGCWNYYHKDTLIAKITYINGVYNDTLIKYFPDRKIKELMVYKNGLYNGKVEFYDDEGFKEEREYSNGKLNGHYCILKDTNKIVDILFKDNQPYTIFKISGSKKLEYNYKGNLVNGEGFITVYLNANNFHTINEERNYSKGKLNGKFASYYLGIKYSEGNFSDGYMTGIWKFYNRFGEDKHEKTYTTKDSLSIDSLGIYRHEFSEIEKGQEVYISSNQIPFGIFGNIDPKLKIPLGKKWFKFRTDRKGNVLPLEFQRAILNEDDLETTVIQIMQTIPIWD